MHRCARMGLFTDCLHLLRCLLLGFRCAAGATDRHGFFRRRRVVWENVTQWACLVCEKSVEIRDICGRQLSAQCAKEQAGCFYSPTDLSDKHRCHADCLSITQIAPAARQIDTDFSQAENLSMWARLTGTPEGAEVHSPAASEAAPWV